MTNRQATFETLNSFEPGQVFPGSYLRKCVVWKTGKQIYISSVLRYLRTWRQSHDCKCISQKHSLYQIGG